MEILMTKEESDIQIIYTGNYFVLDFVYNSRIQSALYQIPNADKGNIVPYKWVIPKEGFPYLNNLNEFIIWKSVEELEKSKNDLLITEETLEDVLQRIPQNIQTPYMKIEPYDFQKLSVGWAITKKGKRGQVYGGILADLMGLGKTIQALAISSKFKELKGIKRCLIVCPATLKQQWSQEIEKFTDEDYILIEGTKKQRDVLFEKIRTEAPFFTIINYELLISKSKSTTPNNKIKGFEQNKKVLNPLDYNVLQTIMDFNFDLIILDEAHRIKNPDSLTSQAIRHIQPEYKLLMTGTPITKDLQNIFNLVDYLSPNILSDGTNDFETRRKQFEDKFLVMTTNKFTKFKQEKIPTGVRNVGLLKHIVSPYMLRRTTEEVSDELPEQTETMIPVEWDNEQKKIYDTLNKELKMLHEKKGKCTDEFSAQKIENEMHSIYTYLLEVCDTPELLTMSDSRNVKRYFEKDYKPKNPPKLIRLLEMAEEILLNGDDKIIIFSKFERMTQILQREFTAISKKLNDNHKKGFNTVLYTGKTPSGCEWKKHLNTTNQNSRNLNCLECPFIDKCNTRTKSQFLFQNHPDTKIIIATDAANYGVNLQSGKYLFNYDLPDSFATYDQRKGRNKRLGSLHKKVFVYNFGIKGAIDFSKFNKLLKQKELIDLVVEKNTEEEHSINEKMAEINMMMNILDE